MALKKLSVLWVVKMKRAKVYLILLLLACQNAFAFNASDIDISTFLSDLSLLIASFISFLVMLLGYKKVLSLIGR
jgi:hypothetical protein